MNEQIAVRGSFGKVIFNIVQIRKMVNRKGIVIPRSCFVRAAGALRAAEQGGKVVLGEARRKSMQQSVPLWVKKLYLK